MIRVIPTIRRLSLLILLAGTSSAWAQQAPPSDPEPKPRVRSTLPESVRRVERQTGGEVLRAEPMQRDGHEVYRLKVLTADGRVRVVQDDPAERKPRPERVAPRSKDKDKEQEKKPSRDPDEQPQF